MQIQIAEFEGQKFVKVSLQNETVRSESGALHYFRGNIEMESKAPSAGGFLSSMVTGETAFKPTYTGSGEVYFGPPNFGEYHILELNDEEWVIDQGAYVCSDMGVEVSAFRNKASAALLGGEGLFQTRVSGTGQVVVQAPGKLQQIQLHGETLAVDGRFGIARSAGIDFSVRRASKSMLGSVTSGEGLVNVFEGHGTVYIAPVPNLYQNLINQTSYMPGQAAASGGSSGGSTSPLVGIAVLAIVGLMMGGGCLVAVIMALAGG